MEAETHDVQPIPQLPAELTEQQRYSCVALVYCCIKLTLQAKGKLSDAQRVELASALDGVLAAGGCKAFPLAVATWLRDKKELGNRLISTALLAQSAHREELRPFIRRACGLVLKLPTDLTELLVEFQTITGDEQLKLLSCLKKAAKDIVENIPAYQALKYDNRGKIKMAKRQLRKAEERLAAGHDTTTGENAGKSSGKGKAATDENRARKNQAVVDELKSKLSKLAKGDLRSLVKSTHAGKDSEKIMGILRKRYPATEEAFKLSGLPGEFDPARADLKMRVTVPEGVLRWDQELSASGNVPATWARLLRAKNDRGMYTLPYMALLRNLRNVLLMGLRPEFLQRHVLRRLTDRRQIQGSGQTAVSISHTWATLEKEFDDAKLLELQKQSTAGVRDIFAYRSILKKIRGPILGTDDKHIGIIGEFLGCPVWEPCGLKRVNGCFLTLNKVQLRDGQVLVGKKGKSKGKGKCKHESKDETKAEKWLPVALHPVTAAFLAELKEVFDQAIKVAATCALKPMSFEKYPEGPVLLWIDHSNPPLDTVAPAVVPVVSEPKCEKDLWMSGIPYDPRLITTTPGQEVELDEITTHKDLVLELRYFCSSYLDYNLHAFDKAGNSQWSATYSNSEIKNRKGQNIVVHCRDIEGNPSPTEPALRTMHVDLGDIDDDTLCLMVTSQLYAGTKPSSVSIALRECHSGGARNLNGDHEPHDCKGKLLLAQDISEPLKKGGTAIYACLIRDANDKNTWVFRNTMDLSLGSMTHVASQATQACGEIFKQLFTTKANMSTVDASRLGIVRLCQLHEAIVAKDSDRVVHVVATGVKKQEAIASAEEMNLDGNYMKDLEVAMALKKRFSGKAVDVNHSLKLALEACGDRMPCAILRVGMNSLVPVQALAIVRERAGHLVAYASIDGRGHLFEALDSLPQTGAFFLPGQVESCVPLLRNLLSTPSAESNSFEALIRYVDGFLPRIETEPVFTAADDDQPAAADDDQHEA